MTPELKSDSAAETFSARMTSLFVRYRTSLGVITAWALFCLALLACWHLLGDMDPAAIYSAIKSIPVSSQLLALLATAAGFVVLLGYEWSACRYANVSLPVHTVVQGGFCAYAIGNAIGFSILSSGSVRYRLYSQYGIGTAAIVRMTLFGSLALGCSLPPLAALAALLDPANAVQLLHLPVGLLIMAAIVILVVTLLLPAGLYRLRLHDQSSPGSLAIRAGNRILHLPGIRLLLVQLPITTLDVLIASFVLYVLLPEPLPFFSFFLIYLLALAAGVLSHVPGGIGVFETVILAALGSQTGSAPLVAALLLYRLIYVIVPFLIASLLLLTREARRLYAAGQKTLQAAAGFAPSLLAILVFLSGIVLLFSGARPELDMRLHHLGFLLPHRLIDFSHLGASLIGVLCLVLAQGLRQRLSAAWVLTLGLLVMASLLSLFKGFDWHQALLMASMAGLLAIFRRAFYRPSRLMELPLSPRYLAASACVVAASIWLVLFVYQDVPYSHELWWQFALDANAPRAMRAALASVLVLLILVLTWLLRPVPPIMKLPDRQQLDEAEHVLRSSIQPNGSLALSGDKALLFSRDRNAFIMYAQRGRSMIALFDPIGSAQERAELIWEFCDLCHLHRVRPVFYQVRADNLPFYMDAGLTAIKLGEEAVVYLGSFDLESKGKEMKDLRYVWNRGQRDGLHLEIFERGKAPLEVLREISDAWLQGKSVREKGFSLGRFTTEYISHFRIVILYFQDRPVAFANLLETDRHELASLDLMRVLPDAPKSSMEFLMLGLIQHFKAQEYQAFSLGMVPLAGLNQRSGAPLPQRLGAMVYERGESFYNFQGLRRFKGKFQPCWEPRYMAAPAGLDPFLALADTATLIAGGVAGLVKR